MSSPLSVPLDHEIVMHREVHFGSSFEAMIEYYEKEEEGACPHLELKRIHELASYEIQTHGNLAEQLLTEEEWEEVERAQEAYRHLHNLLEEQRPSNPVPQLTAALILAEGTEQLGRAIDALVRHKDGALTAMLELLRSEEMHNPLFPGYGLAPTRAVELLTRLGDKRAIIALFEALGSAGDFFEEEALFGAIKSIGAPAKEFLLKLAARSPIDSDSERAIAALSAFKADVEVAEVCWKLLQRPDILAHPIVADYLILACEGLTDEALRRSFVAFASDKNLSSTLQRDIAMIAKSWGDGNSSHTSSFVGGM